MFSGLSNICGPCTAHNNKQASETEVHSEAVYTEIDRKKRKEEQQSPVGTHSERRGSCDAVVKQTEQRADRSLINC